MSKWSWIPAIVLLGSVPALTSVGQTPKPTPEGNRFFESEVRPILQTHCFSCHGAEKKVKGGLNLATRQQVLEGGDTGPAVDLGQPEESLLLLAVKHVDRKMPPRGKLPQPQIDILTKWVKMGLPFPEGGKAVAGHGPPKVDEQARNFWAFKPVLRPALPEVKEKSWGRNPIDAFVLAKLESKNFKPAPPADKTALLRRAYYAVTGLPPSPLEVDDFLNDPSPNAYEKVVDRLLESRHYGEHWGRHWLDLVRYAETNSFERDSAKPFVWRYRDYVIRSFNADKPYDQFIREQLAGDELDEVTADGIIATGYYRLGLWDDEPADPVLAYYDGLDDILGTTGQTFLGLTVNCARCHDHKIDPFPQKDYYKLLAFLHGIRHYGVRSDQTVADASLRPIGDPEEKRVQNEALTVYNRQLEQLNRHLEAVDKEFQPQLPGGEKDDFKYPKNKIPILKRHVGGLVSQETYDHYLAVTKVIAEMQKKQPRALDMALAVSEHAKPKETFVLLRGNHQSKGDKVEPGFPSVLSVIDAPLPTLPMPKPGGASSGRRRVLADWLADPNNPLTARVLVNRVWQYHFGRGIVRSASNFGYMGTPPTHPELLDWLASEFTAGGMKLKALHRLILTSNAFRMSSQDNPMARGVDPENDLLWRYDLRRLTAEEVRDSILAACGNLNLNKKDGPSIYPVIPPEVLAGQSRPGQGWPTSNPVDGAARSVFVHTKRSLALPLLAVFDGPDPDNPCPVRFTTTQPSQALAMINSDFMNEQAKLFAESIRKEAGSQPEARVRQALRKVMQRTPTSAEVERGVRFMGTLREEDGLSVDEALRRFCLLALNLNEFVYLD